MNFNLLDDLHVQFLRDGSAVVKLKAEKKETCPRIVEHPLQF